MSTNNDGRNIETYAVVRGTIEAKMRITWPDIICAALEFLDDRLLASGFFSELDLQRLRGAAEKRLNEIVGKRQQGGTTTTEGG